MNRQWKWMKSMMAICITAVILILGVRNVSAQGDVQLSDQIEQTASSIQKTGGNQADTLLQDEALMLPGDSVSDWTALTLALSGKKDAYADYLKRLEEYVAEQYRENGFLHHVKATEYERISLVMLALGGDPEHVKGDSGEINLIADGIYQFAGDRLDIQGSNALIFGLITLDAGGFEVPEDAKFTREEILKKLLTYQCGDGSFALQGNSDGNPDITAMALQALAPYRAEPEVADAVGRAVNWLSEHMKENGTYEDYGAENAETTAQVILALCALGVDPESTEEFHKGDFFLLDGLNVFRMEDGMYMHTLEIGEADGMASYQSLMALEAVNRLRTDGGWLLDFTDYSTPESAVETAADGSAEKSENGLPVPVIPIAAGAAVVCIAVVLMVKRIQKGSTD